MLRSGFRIGRAFGIDIRIDWSWLFIFALIAWNMSAVFGQSHPTWAPLQVWSTAVIAAILFFASVVGHELAHSLVAKARGIPVRNITLFLFGGVSNIQRDPDSPKAEFWMAIVGPLTSLILGGLLLLLAGASAGPVSTLTDPTKVLAGLGPLTVLLLWLGSINITLGIFNLVPGFPLDGGRVLRSILWAVTGNLRRATRWASGVGQFIAWAMILAGIGMVFGVQIPFFGTGLASGVWLAFIGWFLNSASAESYQQVVVHDILRGVPVERIMRANPPTVGPGISVAGLVHDHIMGTDDYGFPVLDGSRLAGIVTLEDVRKVGRHNWDTATVREIMTPADQLLTATPDEDLADAMDRLSQRDVRQLPVLRGAELAGLLRRQDIMKWLQLHAESFRN
jgi:Zn-dependent protease